MKINEFLKNALKENKHTQKQLSEFIGVPTSTVNNWLKLNRSIPAECIIPICEFLNVSPCYLLTGEDNSPKDTEISNNIYFTNEIEKEALCLFKKLPEREQLKLIGRMETVLENYEKANSEEATG